MFKVILISYYDPAEYDEFDENYRRYLGFACRDKDWGPDEADVIIRLSYGAPDVDVAKGDNEIDLAVWP